MSKYLVLLETHNTVEIFGSFGSFKTTFLNKNSSLSSNGASYIITLIVGVMKTSLSFLVVLGSGGGGFIQLSFALQTAYKKSHVRSYFYSYLKILNSFNC